MWSQTQFDERLAIFQPLSKRLFYFRRADMRIIKRPLITVLLGVLCIYWLLVARVRRWRGIPLKDNCFTWAFRNSSYDDGDGLLLHKSSSGFFPHVAVVRGARAKVREEMTIEEYVPKKRVPQRFPPHTFDGYVRRSELRGGAVNSNPSDTGTSGQS